MEVISIDVAGKSLELGAQPSYGAFNDLCQGEDRTGLRLWALPARRVVKFLEDAPSLVRGKRVVELGCGAHAALARASVLLGACRALATDGSSHIVELASAHCAAAQLRFGEPCVDAPPGMADLVLGSELLYYNTNLDALVATIADQLSQDGVCVLCVVHRIYGGAAALAASALKHGLSAFDSDVAADDSNVVDASRLHVLCRAGRAGRVESLFASAPLLIPVVSDDSDDDDEAAFLAAASGALDE
jgi:predicted nicotinamide N-methyase